MNNNYHYDKLLETLFSVMELEKDDEVKLRLLVADTIIKKLMTKTAVHIPSDELEEFAKRMDQENADYQKRIEGYTKMCLKSEEGKKAVEEFYANDLPEYVENLTDTYFAKASEEKQKAFLEKLNPSK